MKYFRSLIRIIFATALIVALAVGLIGCASDEGGVGNFLDRTLWTLNGFPSQQSILDHLEEKYGEDFTIQSLNSGARFYQGHAFPTANPDLVFNLKMIDKEGSVLPVEDMRDDYQARLAEVMIAEPVQKVVSEKFGAAEIADLRVEVSLFGTGEENTTLPASFDWLPDDGLEALATQLDVSVMLNMRLMLETGTAVDGITNTDGRRLAEAIVSSAKIPLSGEMTIRAADDGAEQGYKIIVWKVEDGQMVSGGLEGSLKRDE